MDNKECSVSGCTAATGCVKACGLHELAVGGCGRVVGVSGDSAVRRRLLEMGFCNGANVEVIRRAPLGDPIEFRLRGYHLSLRSEQASQIMVQAQ